jgi:glycosyltransferase involved in cell wall biosynthesis
MTEIMTQAGVAEPEKFVTIYSGMEVEPLLEARRLHRDSMRQRFGFTEQHTVFIKIARLFHLKGHEDVIRAAKRVVSRVPNTRWLFVGDGILRESLESKLRQEGLADHFVFTGLVDPSEIPAHIAAADALVHSSYREGLARAIPQALLTGIPAISYDVDGAREVVLDEITGYLVKPGDIEELASAMNKLAESPEKCQRMGSEGQGRFTDRFRHQAMTAQIRELYTQILNNH